MIDDERCLCFRLGTESFAIPLLMVKEVMAMPAVAPIPQAPPAFLGMMNLRGQVIGVVDLRQKLGIQPSKTQDEKAVVILDFKEFRLGAVVDLIDSVQNLDKEKRQDKPKVQGPVSHDYITSVYLNGDKFILILDIQKILGVSETQFAKNVNSNPQKAA